MKILFLFGDAAVGKMTVGQKLCEITPFKLFHNHMTIEPVLEIFGEFHQKTIMRMREVVFEEFAKTNNYGLIATFMFDFDCKEDWEYTKNIANIFEKQGAEIYYVELVAPLEVRLERNKTPNRLEHKPSKRKVKESEERVIASATKHRCVSYDGEITFKNVDFKYNEDSETLLFENLSFNF